MASIVQRSNRYNVVYLYDDEATGKRKQKWESIGLSSGIPEAGYSRTWAFENMQSQTGKVYKRIRTKPGECD